MASSDGSKASRFGRLRPGPALRGLALGLSLSAANLAGAWLTVLLPGGLGEWTAVRFIGLFGLIEIATGAAFVVGPNIWRLPVAEVQIPSHTPVRFAASTVLIPHWAGGVKSVAGAAMVVAALVAEGVGVQTAGLAVVATSICAASVGLSMVAARIGVARPERDVIQFVLRRPGRPDHELPAQSIGAMVVQFLLNIGAFPAVKVLPPRVLYGGVMAPSAGLVGWSAGIAALLLGAGVLAWWGRLTWRAPAPQQREAEEEFAAA